MYLEYFLMQQIALRVNRVENDVKTLDDSRC
jgi:hypothetical protein